MIEILAEATIDDGAPEIDARRRQHGHVDPLGVGAAQAADGMVLDDREQLALERRRQEPDLVEEHRAAVRGLDETDLGVARVGEGAALVAEKLRLEQGLGNGGAVHLHERTGATRPGSVDAPGEESLARPGLAQDQDCRRSAGPLLAGQEPGHLSPDRFDAGASAWKASNSPAITSRSLPPPVPMGQELTPHQPPECEVPTLTSRFH